MICEFIALAEQGTDVGFAVFRVKVVEATVKMLMTQENANITYPIGFSNEPLLGSKYVGKLSLKQIFLGKLS